MTEITDLHRSIAALLERRSTGQAVARELDDRYVDWQTRAVIAELRERRAQDRYDRKLARLLPDEFGDVATHH